VQKRCDLGTQIRALPPTLTSAAARAQKARLATAAKAKAQQKAEAAAVAKAIVRVAIAKAVAADEAASKTASSKGHRATKAREQASKKQDAARTRWRGCRRIIAASAAAVLFVGGLVMLRRCGGRLRRS
jgi:hypothetical protein